MLKTKIALLLLLLLNTLLFSETTVEERTSDISHDIVFGQKPSELPTGGLIHDFKPMQKNLFTDVDVSVAPEAKLFAGYGVYDIAGENCVYIDVKVDDGSSADMKFMEFKVFNGHTYGVSINDMSYAECQATTVKYSGYPVNITSETENESIALMYSKYEFWIGSQRAGPCPSLYVDSRGVKSLFNGFENQNEICSDLEPYVVSDQFASAWSKKGVVHTSKCIVEFNTEDWAKPLKSCAPWWGIERDYLLPTKSKYSVTALDSNGDFVELDIRDFNQKDFPKVLEMCTQLDINSTTANTEPTTIGTQNVVCNSYYDRTASPRCMDNPEQSLCKVNECRGAIQDRCQLIRTGDAPLDYSKDPVYIDGEFQYIKKRVGIKIHEYKCPIIKAGGDCKETQSITVLPQICPGTDVNASGDQVRPIRTYGNPTLSGPNKYDADGILRNLYGTCPDGTTIEIPVNVLKQNSRICLEYETIIDKREYDQMCSVDKIPTDYTVQSGITGVDAYTFDENCVRTNNIEDARPRQDIRIDYETFGMANLAIIKAQVDNLITTPYEILVPSLYYQRFINDMQYREESLNLKNANTLTATDLGFDVSAFPQLDCTEWDNGEPDPFFNKLLAYQTNGVKNVYDYSAGVLVDFGSITKAECTTAQLALSSSILWGADDTNATDVSATDVLYETSYQLGSIIGVSSADLIEQTDLSATISGCIGVVVEAPSPGDVYNLIDVNAVGDLTPPDFNFYSTASVDYYRCREIALCNSMDILNVNKYAGLEQCRLHLTDTSGEAAQLEYQAELDAELIAQLAASDAGGNNYPADNDLAARSETGVLALDQIDGFTDVYAVLEYTDFNFGYASSYSFRNFKSNRVKVNNLLVHPIAPHSRIMEYPREDYTWNYTTYRNKKPSAKAALTGAVGGGASAVAGAAAYGAAFGEGALIGIGTAMGPWGYAAVILIGAIVAVLMTPINLITFIGMNTGEVYAINDAQYRYVTNPYGYESRTQYEKNNEARIKYADFKYGTTGRMKKSNASKHFAVLQETKNTFYKELNIEINGFVFPPHEVTLPVADPDKCKWYNPWCKKSLQGNGEGTLDADQYHSRPLTVHYMGATNTATIVVPYKGDYVVEGYNAQGHLIGSDIVAETSFIYSNADAGELTMAYAHVMLGESMAISSELIGDACVTDLMAEVGGGVSGAYYELGKTGKFTDFTCSKSTNRYVIDNSMVKLIIRPLDQLTTFSIDLKKPMPYVNRIFVATMGFSEDRNYRCYSNDFPECLDFETVSGEE